MRYEIEVAASGRLLRLQAQGDVSVELAREWSVEFRKMVRAHGITRFLSDMGDAINVSSIVDNYYFAYHDGDRLGLASNVRTTILAGRGDKSHDFIVNTMNNTELNVRLFNDESTAVSWLEEYPH